MMMIFWIHYCLHPFAPTSPHRHLFNICPSRSSMDQMLWHRSWQSRRPYQALVCFGYGFYGWMPCLMPTTTLQHVLDPFFMAPVPLPSNVQDKVPSNRWGYYWGRWPCATRWDVGEESREREKEIMVGWVLRSTHKSTLREKVSEEIQRIGLRGDG